MFISDLQTLLKRKAESLRFEKDGYIVSDDLKKTYENMKKSYLKITDWQKKDRKEDIESQESSKNSFYDKQFDIIENDEHGNSLYLVEHKAFHHIMICKEMVNFYSFSHDLLQNLLTECFKDDFYMSLEKMNQFFVFFNKVCKLLFATDIVKIKNPSIFGNYCEAKLKNEEVFNLNVHDAEDLKICTIHLISFPFGRLFLSFLTHPEFDMEHPVTLAKTMKIYLNTESIKRISLFIYISEENDWQYLMMYFIALFFKLTGSDPFITTDPKIKKYKNYIELLKLHL